MSIKEVSEANFKSEVLESDIPVLVDLWAVWCAPCRAMGDVLKEVVADLEKDNLLDKIKIVKVNVDECGNIATTYGIRSIPTLMVFKAGEQVYCQAGLKSATDLNNLIKSYI